MNRRHFLIASGVAIVAAVTGAFFLLIAELPCNPLRKML